SRPNTSCSSARADQARHHSFHGPIEAVTSWKSVSDTPLATKRAPQWLIAALTCGSVDIGSVHSLVAAIPGQETPRTPVDQKLEADAESREQQHADEGLVVMEGARVRRWQ